MARTKCSQIAARGSSGAAPCGSSPKVQKSDLCDFLRLADRLEINLEGLLVLDDLPTPTCLSSAQLADYGLVADLYTALPELAAELAKIGR